MIDFFFTKIIYSYIALFFINFFIIQILSTLKIKNEIILKYINEIKCFKENYKIWKKKYILFIIIYFIILNLILPIIILIITIWFIIHTIKFIKYKYSWDYLDLKLKKKDTYSDPDVSFFKILKYVIFKLTKSIGFLISYSIIKFLNDKKNIKIKELYTYFNNMLIIFMIGVGPNTIWFLQEISYFSLIFFTQASNKNISKINKIKIFLSYELFFIINQTMFNNNIIEKCRLLRIYKSNWKIKFNPDPKKFPISKTSDVFKEFTYSKFGRTAIKTHPIYIDLPVVCDDSDKNIEAGIQFTSRTLKGMSAIQYTVKSYKQNTHFGVYNIIQQHDHLIFGKHENLFQNMGIFNIEKIKNFNHINWVARTLDKNSGIYIDKKNINLENKEILEKFIENDKNFNENIVNIQEKAKIFNINKKTLNNAENFQKKISSLSTYDQLILNDEWNIEKTKIVNYFDYLEENEYNFEELNEFLKWTKDLIKI